MRNANKHRLKLINAGATMKSSDFELMSTDELWALHEEITATLEGRLAADKTRLEERLRQLGQGGGPNRTNRSGRNVGAGRRILGNHPRLGPVAGSSPAGYQHNSNLEENWMLSESNRLITLVGSHISLN